MLKIPRFLLNTIPQLYHSMIYQILGGHLPKPSAGASPDKLACS